MPYNYKTGNFAHDTAMAAAAVAWHAAVVPGASAATIKAADLAYARAAALSCQNNNNYSGSSVFNTMRKELGVQT
jgi:hypothetical protein